PNVSVDLAIPYPYISPEIMFPLHSISNCSQPLIGATCIRRLAGGTLRFDDSRHVGVFVFGSIVGVFVSCFFDAGIVELVGGWGRGTFWELWRSRFFSNVLAELTVVPAIIAWSQIDVRNLRKVSMRSLAEV